MTRKQRLGAAMALIKHFTCDRFREGPNVPGCEECSMYMTDTFGIEDRCPYTDLQTLLGEPYAKMPAEVNADGHSEGGK